ncbi:protein fem-1 homolog C-like [Macrobrachium nipponense]|uniref:protein fem-1 homolog C-like n=1 Tax=Macrobrachium nipponense TaxID=159736 RepID=UPI0030C7E3AF
MAARDCNGCKSHGQTFPSGVKYCVERVKEGRDSILCTAALLGHTNCVRILVEFRGADVEELGSVSTGGPLLSGVSPLWCAAFEEHYWVVAYLLSKGANPNGDTSFYSTPLQAACELGYFHIVRLLVEHGAYIEAADDRAVTCLMLASFGGHLEIVKYLLDLGADVNSKNIEGESALHACAKAGHLEVMKLLLEHNAWMGADYSGLTPLTVGSSRGHRDMVEYLLSRNDLVSVKEKADALELLGASLFNSTEDIVATVNYWKSAINQRYVNGALIYPKTQDNLSCPSDEEFSEVNTLEELESIELDPQEVQLQALLVMERILGPGHLQTLKIFNRIGIACVNRYAIKRCIKLWTHAIGTQRNQLNPLHQSRLFHFRSLADLFGFLTNTESARNWNDNPKEYAEGFINVFSKGIEEMELIISALNNADDYVRSKHKSHVDQFIMIVLHFLVPFTRLQPDLPDCQRHTVKKAMYTLVKKGLRNSRGSTPLQVACSPEFEEIEDPDLPMSATPRAEVVTLLLETGSDPSATDNEGNTPLHAIAKNEECPKGIVDALLSRGAHLDARNGQGQTFASLRADQGQPVSQLVNVVRHTSLQCLAASCIKNHSISYKGILHPRLEQFVDMH